MRTVLAFVARRLAIMAILLILVSVGVFSLLALEPGNPINNLLGLKARTPATVHALEAQYHLNQSFLQQYFHWAVNALQLNFGQSIQTSLPVGQEIGSRLPVSLFLGIYAYVLTMVVGVVLGVVAALRRRTLTDRSIVTIGILGLSTPAFVTGLILIYVLGDIVKVFPTFGYGSGFSSELFHLTLPAVALGFTCVAFVAKHTRASVLNVIDQDYVTFARARGLGWGRILLWYYLRNGLMPIVSISTALLAYMIAGAVLVEVTFSIPGIGNLLVTSSGSKDIPVVQGIAIVLAALIMLLNLLTDVIYMFVDPRIRFGAAG
jgi:peptide/nickel transport system permease protein